VVLLVAFVLIVYKFWKYLFIAIVVIGFVLVCAFGYTAWSNGATQEGWFTFIVMAIAFINSYLLSKNQGIL